MIESFVDLSYRSLPLGRRVKLTQVRPSTGYLETPTPMPVGTTIAIATDEGVGFDAVVSYIHEQIGGADRQPGMTITPALADDKASSWWQARVALPELAARPAMTLPRAPAPPPTVIPRGRRTAEMPGVPEAKTEIAPPPPTTPPVIDDGVKTTVMQAIDDPALIDQLPSQTDPVLVDDGKKTIVMEAVDVRALGLEPSSTGEIPVIEVGDDDSSEDDKSDANGGKPKVGSSRRRRGKRR
ncbi:MAG TPA: hypothetical protein VGO00_27410 [Kofleriaceae bacterium]|nr:hypothetical protein [Kofleriaceae bacterium]